MLAELRDCCADLLLAAESWSASPSGRVWRRVAKRPIRGKETGGGRLIAVLEARGGEMVSVGPEAAASCSACPLTSTHFVHAGGQYYVPMPGLSQRLRDGRGAGAASSEDLRHALVLGHDCGRGAPSGWRACAHKGCDCRGVRR